MAQKKLTGDFMLATVGELNVKFAALGGWKNFFHPRGLSTLVTALFCCLVGTVDAGEQDTKLMAVQENQRT